MYLLVTAQVIGPRSLVGAVLATVGFLFGMSSLMSSQVTWSDGLIVASLKTAVVHPRSLRESYSVKRLGRHAPPNWGSYGIGADILQEKTQDFDSRDAKDANPTFDHFVETWNLVIAILPFQTRVNEQQTSHYGRTAQNHLVATL